MRFLLSIVVNLGAAALGLLAAKALVDGFVIPVAAFLSVIVVFALLQAILSPIIAKAAAKWAPSFVGGVALISTFVSLLVSSWIFSDMKLGGLGDWIFATLIVWVVTAIATIVLGKVLFKQPSATD